jgi:hypothetical protein
VKAPSNAGRWLVAALILVIVVVEVSDAVRAGGANRRLSAIQVNGAPRAASPAAPKRPLGIPHDWSHRHLIFSRPASPQAARRLERDPRYRIQQAWRHRQAVASTAEAYMQSLDAMAVQLASARRSGTMPPPKGKKPPKPTPTPTNQLHGDWTVSLNASGPTAGSVGTGRYPAKYSFNISGTPDCANDFVVFNTSLSGTATQASIIAFNQLYLGSTGSGGCGTSGIPAVAWAYNTGGKITNSVVLSADGSQIAFPQTVNSAASLVILKWKSAQGTSVTLPVPPDSGNTTTDPNAYVSCKSATNPTKSCQLNLTFSGSTFPNDTNSSPFYDYSNDVIYVGDDSGAIHKFINVFNGTPSEVTNASPWPISVRPGVALTSPVIDSGASPPVIYVGEHSSGFIDYVSTASCSSNCVTRSGTVGHNTSVDIADAPIIDPVAGKIYVGVSNDGNGNSSMFLFNRSFGSGTTGTNMPIGIAAGVNSILIYSGAFDNSYYASSNATGKLYVCGNAGGNPSVYQVPINAGAFAPLPTPTPIPVALGSANVTCSPVTEIYNPNASGGPFDWIFVSVQNNGSLTNCSSGGCVMNLIVTAWRCIFVKPGDTR